MKWGERWEGKSCSKYMREMKEENKKLNNNKE